MTKRIYDLTYEAALEQESKIGRLEQALAEANKRIAELEARLSAPEKQAEGTEYMVICWDCGAKAIAGSGALDTCYKCGGANVVSRGSNFR